MLIELEQVASAIRKAHFAILELPKRFGYEEVLNELGAGVIKIEPTVHEKQKTRQINVDDVAFLERVCRNRQAGRQVFVLSETERMGAQAQNKFLKLLEEPIESVAFVFVTEDAGNLLSTVKSRAQIFRVREISDEESERLVQGVDAMKKRQILFLAKGLPREIKKLVGDEGYFAERKVLIDVAKVMISGTGYEKMCEIQKLKDERERAIEVVGLAIVMAKATVTGGDARQIARLEELSEVHEGLVAGMNVRLAMGRII